jgi:hypothetical protein
MSAHRGEEEETIVVTSASGVLEVKEATWIPNTPW